MLTDTSQSPYAKLRSVALDAVHWTESFWHEQLTRCHEVMIPNMWALLKDPKISHAYTNFLIAAGEEPGTHEGPQWHDGDFYKWLESVAVTYAVSKDPHLDALMDEIIALLARIQRPDGYIHTPVIIRQQADTEAKPLQERLDFETYNMGHLMTAGCLHYRATGKETLLALAIKSADWLYRFYKEASPELARNAICPSHYMGVIELYRTTREPRYLELGQNLIEIRDLVTNGGDDNQDRVPFREQTEAVGHAVRANYLYAGVADVYAETGDASLLNNLESIWKNVVEQKMYITGACGALYDGASPDGSEAQHTITRIHQAYGRDYQLPNSTAHNETCANIANAMWNWRMLTITGEARFADVLELALYNSVLSGIGLDGKSFFYTNTLRQVNDLPYELRWGNVRTPYISCFCCPPNLVRTIAEVGSYAYSLSEAGLWVHLYGSNTLDTKLIDGSPIRLRQQSNYPWDGQISLTIEAAPASAFALKLRIPGWAKGASIRVNGDAISQEIQPGSYVSIERSWQAGDLIELDLPLPARLIEANPLVEENRNQVAVMRGPLVYCLESPDLPADIRPTDVFIPASIQLNAKTLSDPSTPLSGISLLEGMAQIRPSQHTWANTLYRELVVAAPQEVPIRLIPYYAWANRGESEMTVWMPLA